jgi:hypothetical protein
MAAPPDKKERKRKITVRFRRFCRPNTVRQITAAAILRKIRAAAIPAGTNSEKLLIPQSTLPSTSLLIWAAYPVSIAVKNRRIIPVIKFSRKRYSAYTTMISLLKICLSYTIPDKKHVISCSAHILFFPA